jgi:hypothetical protein
MADGQWPTGVVLSLGPWPSVIGTVVWVAGGSSSRPRNAFTQDLAGTPTSWGVEDSAPATQSPGGSAPLRNQPISTVTDRRREWAELERSQKVTSGAPDNLLSGSRSDKRHGAHGLGDPATPGPNLLWLRHPDNKLSGLPGRHPGPSVTVERYIECRSAENTTRLAEHHPVTAEPQDWPRFRANSGHGFRFRNPCGRQPSGYGLKTTRGPRFRW